MKDNTYCAHPFMIATYSFEGKFIDDFAWWEIGDDTTEWIETAAFKNNTFEKGIEDDEYSKYTETILTGDGHFKTIKTRLPTPNEF